MAPDAPFRLLAITDRASLGARGMPGMPEWLHGLGAAGVDAVQVREKDLDDRAVYGLARLARSVLPPSTRVLVNGRLDVALAAGGTGVHLPAGGVPVAALRRRFGPGVLIGRSTHSLAEVERARDEGADYVTFGPVYPTPSKERYGPAAVPDALARAAASAGCGLPVYALGGVTLARFGEVAAAGAAGVAGIRLFQDPAQLGAVVRAARLHFAPHPR